MALAKNAAGRRNYLIMNFYEELSKVNGNGLLMLDALKQAAATGLTQQEAVQVLEKLFWESSAQGEQKQEDVIVDLMDIAKNYCRPEFRIWEVQ